MHEKDIETAKAIHNSDENALRIFFAENVNSLYRFIYYRVAQNKEDAEDLLQETVMSAIGSIRNFKGKSSLFTWLCGIAKHKILTFHRKHMRKIEKMDKVMEVMIGDLEQKHLNEDTIKQTKSFVNIVLSALPVHYQKCLVQKYIEEQPVKTIAENFGTTEKAIESMLMRAKEAFKKAFETFNSNSEYIGEIQ